MDVIARGWDEALVRLKAHLEKRRAAGVPVLTTSLDVKLYVIQPDGQVVVLESLAMGSGLSLRLVRTMICTS